MVANDWQEKHLAANSYMQSICGNRRCAKPIYDLTLKVGGMSVCPECFAETHITQQLPTPVEVRATTPAREMRQFGTGATRDGDQDKYDYEGFLAPSVVEAYGAYMHKNRLQRDGNLRDSDNWQKGIPKTAYVKSMFRHFFAVWKGHRAGTVSMDDLMALLFNVQGYAFEVLKGETHKERT